MVFGPDHEYKVGDDAWVYLSGHQGEMTKGTVVAVLADLPGWGLKNYVIELPTPIDPLLEVRSASAMRPSDPRIGRIADFLGLELGEAPERCRALSAQILEIIEEQ